MLHIASNIIEALHGILKKKTAEELRFLDDLSLLEERFEDTEGKLEDVKVEVEQIEIKVNTKNTNDILHQ